MTAARLLLTTACRAAAITAVVTLLVGTELAMATAAAPPGSTPVQAAGGLSKTADKMPTKASSRAHPTPTGARGPVGDKPPTPVTNPFHAPLCEGPTFLDPTQQFIAPASGYSADMVWGGRLDDYNAGAVVPLYDNAGTNQRSQPICTTRYVTASGGPVSTWTYCTDRDAWSCNITNSEGNLIEHRGGGVLEEINPTAHLPGNSRLTGDQEKIIADLIQNGHEYNGTGFWDLRGATQGTSDLGASERAALQILVWCISDPEAPTKYQEPNAAPDYLETCEDSLPAQEQQNILAQAQDPAILALRSAQRHISTFGDPARFSLRTNVFDRPITLGGSRAVKLTVCDGVATLEDGVLSVPSPAQGTVAHITICAKTATAGRLSLSASAKPGARSLIQWSQSRHNTFECQVYAGFGDTVLGEAHTTFTFRRQQPEIRTRTSSAVASPGVQLRDRLHIRGLTPPYSGEGTATLYGPFSSRADITCRPKTALDTVTFPAHNGQVLTRPIRITEPGYYTWVAKLSADKTHDAAKHRCGMARETSLVRKNPIVSPPDVEAGFSGTTVDKFGPAGSLRFAGIGLGRASTITTRIRQNTMVLPSSTADVALLRESATPGDAIGTAVIGGHVSDQHNNPGALWDLRKAKRGQLVKYTSADGSTTKYRVTSKHTYIRGEIPLRVFKTTGPARLALITCTGITQSGSHFHYTQNLVVTAVPVS